MLVEEFFFNSEIKGYHFKNLKIVINDLQIPDILFQRTRQSYLLNIYYPSSAIRIVQYRSINQFNRQYYCIMGILILIKHTLKNLSSF